MKTYQRLFAEQYNQHIDEIYRYVFFKVNQHKETAEDLTSKIFTKAWKSMRKFDPNKASFRTYIYRIAQTSVIDHYRTNKPTAELHEDSKVAPEGESVDVSLMWQKAYTVLSEEAYEMMVLKYRNDLSIKQIADVMQKTEDAVKSQLKRSRKELQQAYE